MVGGIAAVVMCLSSCAGGHSSGGGPAPVASSIRGSDLPGFSCKATSGGQSLSVKPAAVIELRVCALAAPSPFNRPPHPISLARSTTGFAALLRALSLPDASPTPGQMCPAYAELRPAILARTGSQAMLVHEPVDGCDHALPAVSAALAAVIDATYASPSPAAPGQARAVR